MAIYKKGADPEALDRSAELLVQYGRETAAVRQSVGVVLGSLKDNWGGGNLQALIQQWPAIEAQIDVDRHLDLCPPLVPHGSGRRIVASRIAAP